MAEQDEIEHESDGMRARNGADKAARKSDMVFAPLFPARPDAEANAGPQAGAGPR